MGKIIAYDLKTLRWLNESTPNNDPNDKNNVFMPGFDDPTYLTFKIEFGAWGASTLSISTIKTMQLLNVELEGNKVHGFNYDDYPVGLLDLNFAETIIKQQPYYAFNQLNIYNAYNYLLLRNEDVRAEYLKNFVEGLYEVQLKYSYVFKEISGLNSLEQFNPTSGQRLKDAKITIKCIEGLGQKIRTLLEWYKKAAWDAVYQRWVLPENYRQFKMIIYIFERRVFHTVAKGDGGSKSLQNIGSSIVNMLLSAAANTGPLAQIAGQAHPLCIDPLNSLLPVYAYECDLCEFLIGDNGIGDTFSNSWDSGDALETTLEISVKNVRTYYYNDLTESKLSNLVVMDFIDHLARANTYYANITAHLSFLDRNAILGDEIGIEERIGFGGGGASSAGGLKDDWKNMVNNWKEVFKKKSKGKSLPDATPSNDPATVFNTFVNLMNAESLELVDDRWRNWWHDASMQEGSIFGGDGKKTLKNFFKGLGKIITAGTTQIRLSPGYPNALSSVFNNILDWLEYNNDYEGMYYSYATRADELDVRSKNALANNLDSIEYEPAEYYNYRSQATHDNKLSQADAKKATEHMTNTEKLLKGNDASTNTIKAKRDGLLNPDNYNVSTGEDINSSIGIDSALTTIIDTKLTINESDNMEQDIEFPEYTYPNNEMETVDFVNHATTQKIPENISFNDYKIARDTLKKNLNKNQGNIIVNKPNGKYGSLISVDGGLNKNIADENGMVVIEKNTAIEVLLDGTTTVSKELTKLDEVFYTTENMISTMLKDSELLLNKDALAEKSEHIGDVTELLDLAKEFANENEALKAEYVEYVTGLLDNLKDSTLEVIEYIPEMEMLGYDDENDANKTFIEMPIEAAQQLENNMQLYSIERPQLSGMSMQTIMAIDKNTTEALVNTQAMLEAIKSDE